MNRLARRNTREEGSLAGHANATADVRIHVSLSSGDAEATVWGCDLSDDSVRFSADHTTRVERRAENTNGGKNTNGKIPTMRVTDKGQVTIPKHIRDAAGIGPGSEVEFELRDNVIVVRKRNDGPTRGRRLAERLRGRGDVEMSTDEIMALTRGD